MFDIDIKTALQNMQSRFLDLSTHVSTHVITHLTIKRLIS